MLSAEQIHANAPLGTLIRFSNGEPRPPERFTRKLRAWEKENGTGRLVERHDYSGSSTRLAPTFTLHIGDYGESGAIVLTVRRTFSTEGSKQFEMLETPKPGSVRVLTTYAGHDELVHLAADMAGAQRWMTAHHYPGARVDVVPYPDPVIPPRERKQAA